MITLMRLCPHISKRVLNVRFFQRTTIFYRFPMNTMKSLILHTVIGAYHFTAVWLLIRHLYFEMPESLRAEELQTIPPSHIFMTVWNFAQLVAVLAGYLLLDVLNILNTANNLRKKLKRLLDFYFYSINVPLSFIVAIGFWSMYSYDKRLFHLSLDELESRAFPPLLNHILHTFILVVVFIQTIHNRDVPFNFMKLPKGLAIHSLVYGTWIYTVYLVTGRWPYAFVYNIEEPYRILLMILIYCGGVLINFIFHSLNKLYCESNLPAASRSKLHKRK